jgi:hypothetical protein
MRTLGVLLFLAQSGGRSAKINVSKQILQWKFQISSLEIKLLCTERKVCKRNEDRKILNMCFKALQNWFIF